MTFSSALAVEELFIVIHAITHSEISPLHLTYPNSMSMGSQRTAVGEKLQLSTSAAVMGPMCTVLCVKCLFADDSMQEY